MCAKKSKSDLGIILKENLVKPGYNKVDLLNSLKYFYSYDQIKGALPHISKHPLVIKFIYGNPLPTSYHDLRSGFYTRSSKFQHEIYWSLISVLKYKRSINGFLLEREQFERKLLLGAYHQAKESLKIIGNISFTIWGLENRLVIEDLIGGIEKNKEFLTQVNNGKLEPILALLAHFFSNKAEKKISFTRYSGIVNSFIQDLSENLKQYLNFKLNYFNSSNYSEISSIIGIEEKSSVIDKYLTIVLICQDIICNSEHHDEKQTTIEILNQLKNHINDPLINQLLLIVDPDNKESFREPSNSNIVAYDYYTIGDYRNALIESKRMILLNPNDFSLYKLYVKSLLYLDAGFKPIDDTKSLTNEILEDVYNISSKNNATEQSIARILKNVCLLQSLSISHQLYGFCSELWIDIKTVKHRINGYVRASPHNPAFYLAYDDPSNALKYLNNLKRLYPSSITLDFFIELNLKLKSSTITPSELPRISPTRRFFYNGKLHHKLSNYLEALEIFESLLRLTLNSAIYEEIIVLLFDCYLKIKHFDKCINLFVDNYLKNKNIVLKINILDIHKQIESSRFNNVAPTINLPIFFYVTKQDPHAVNVALRVFLKAYDLKRPSELQKYLTNFDIVYLKFLLQNVCTEGILKYSVYFKSTKDILSERLIILQILNSLEIDFANYYKDDIRRITQNLAIIDGIREVDESKIYVDVKGLVTNEFSDIKTNFNRYIEISSLIEEKPFVFIDILSNKKYLLNVFSTNQTEEQQQEAKMAKNFKFELFKELFLEIEELFLFSNKYGLDSYLSTRIRHGTLLGQIRSEFQNQHLITQKDKSKEEYFPNDYWNERLSLNSETLGDIQELLAKFSLEIDTIATNLKEKSIQIKTVTNKKEGLFDYIITKKSLEIYFERHFKKVTDYNVFLESVFFLLWQQTKTNLEIIQNFISTDIKDQIINLLINLEKDIKAIVADNKEVQELLNNIINCRLHIVTELDKIADWFSIKENVVADFTIEKVIDTSIEITNKLSQTIKLSPNHDIQSRTVIRGEYFIHFFDLLRIFLENVTNYSDLPSEDLDFSITVNEVDNQLKFIIKNKLPSYFDIESLSEKFKIRRTNLNSPDWDMEKIKKEVGGTGFYKAKNILSTHLKDENNSFAFFVNDQNYVEINITVDINNLKA